MTQALPTWHASQPVHRPFAFLLGEKLDGRIQGTHGNTALVTWPDGDATTELLEDLAPGAHPAQPVKTGPLQALSRMLGFA